MREMRMIASEALLLGPVERAQLIEELLNSFDAKNRAELDRLWADEAENRIEAFEAGKLAASSAQDVFRRVK